MKVNKLRQRYRLTVDIMLFIVNLQLRRLVLWCWVGRLKTVFLKFWKDSVIGSFKLLSQYAVERLRETMNTSVMMAIDQSVTKHSTFCLCIEHYHCTSLLLAEVMLDLRVLLWTTVCCALTSLHMGIAASCCSYHILMLVPLLCILFLLSYSEQSLGFFVRS
jgi:hypothetical protein